MLTIRVQITEDAHTRLEAEARRWRQPFERLLQAVFQRGLEVPVQGRYVIVSGAQLETLEAILGGGALTSPQDLQQKVERLAGISMEHLRLPFTPGQLETIADKAQREGVSPQVLIERAAPQVYRQFFDLLGGR